MDSATLLVLAGALISVLLAVVGVLLLRLLNGIDENTKATVRLQLAVERINAFVGTEKGRVDKLEHEIEKSRIRYHDFVNKTQEIISQFQLQVRDLQDKARR